MDLASILSEGIEAASACQKPPRKTAAVPAVPGQEADSGNGQVIENIAISRSSRSSRPSIAPHGSDQSEAAQACAGAGAGVRARGWLAECREQREQREQPAGSDTYSSRSLSLKRELRGETGTEALPEGPTAAPPVPLPPTFDERAAFLEYECGLSRTAAEAQARSEIRRAEIELLLPVPPVSGPLLPTNDGLALWRAGLGRLHPERLPCPDYRPGEWAQVYARAVAFLDTFGETAEALGWTAVRLFGVHPKAGIVRVDACGGLVLGVGGAVRAITNTDIRFGHLTHRRLPGQPAGVPIWEFGR
ncbi:hypothetical protein [Methylobacterium pseudosasicola]|uniref:Uncharacterized protein n=1 Tax=Methylobacterium pseudosasicola TaxID=582667 RepID=A0A1I4SDE7_9HYPH|nr:hypothetical protein [Methylobacterium pseudosasicola]SFM62354.1 hypothetical protein SAMN05192568_104157 [Methylobacterium pseudosasicola]